MSEISDQIKALRIVGKLFRNEVYGKLLNDAADTIEELSAKLATANMERSTAFDIEAILKKLDKEAEKAMHMSEKAAELGKAYERHMVYHGGRGNAFEVAIEIVKRGGVDEQID